MSFISYILLYAISRGLKTGDFHPNLFYDTAAFAVLLVGLEVLLVKAGWFILGPPSSAYQSNSSNSSVIEQIAVAGYKFFHVCLVILSKIILGDLLSWAIFFYGSAAAAVFVFKSNNRSGKQWMAWAESLIQVPICWFLIPK